MKKKKGRIVAWPHQNECLAAITSARRRRFAVALYVMASGLGKTFTSAFDFRRFRHQHPGARMLFLAHQNDLLEQAAISYEQIFGNSVTYGFFNGEDKQTRADVTFATFQSLQQALFGKKRKGRRPFGVERFDYIVVDESHHSQALTYREVIDYFRPEFLLGMTATPDRMDMIDIREIFGPEVFSLDLEEALTQGLLTPVDYRIMADEIVDKGEIDVPPHLVSIKKLNRIFFARKRDEEIVETILRKVQGIANPRIIVFDASIEHANQFAEMMPGAVAIHSKVPKAERDKRIALIRQGIVCTAVTVDQFNEGIDIPETNVLVFLRSTQSPRIFRQQLGRGLRKLLGKKKVLVLDFVANCERLAFLDELRTKLKDLAKARGKTGAGKRKKFAVDWGKVVFEERVQKIIALLKQAKLPLTDERLLQYLWDFYVREKRAPKFADFCTAKGLAGTGVYQRYFGSIVKAMLKAGIPESALSKGQIGQMLAEELTDDELLERLREFHCKHNRVPVKNDLLPQKGMPSNQTYRDRFGSLPRARTLAGISVEIPWRTTDVELLDVLQSFYCNYGRAPRGDEFGSQNGMPSIETYGSRFGGLIGACKLAGVPIDPADARRLKTKHMSDGEIIEAIQVFYRKKGRAPKTSEYGRQDDLADAKVLTQRFGSVTQALKRACVPLPPRLAVKEVTNRELLVKLRLFYRKNRRAPMLSDFSGDGILLAVDVYKRRFGGHIQACLRAGIPKSALHHSQARFFKKKRKGK
ncbi:DEAD/DEAH box helicase [Patescibacteria group bacterium]|nr:DEAD/DEAH box helicase [Patescibacteria group bacterium]